MKNKFALGLVTGAAALLLIAAAEYDLNKGIDLSGLSSVTTTKLNQLVDNGTVAGNKGMIIYTNTTPDTTNNTRYTRFLWMDTSYSPPVPKVYYTNGSFWTNITANTTIADNSVTAGKIAQNAVYTSNIVDNAVTDVKILAGAVTSSKIASGSISNVHVAGYTLNSTNIATNGIVGFNITSASVTGDKIASGSIGTTHLTNGFTLYGTNIANVTIGSNHIANAGLSITNLPTNVITSAYIATGTLPTKNTSANTALPAAGATATIAHTLSGVPSVVRVVLVATSNDAASAFSTGDEVDINGVYSSGTYYGEFSWTADATNVKIIRSSTGGTFEMRKRDTGVIVAVSSTANWNLKVYSVYIP